MPDNPDIAIPWPGWRAVRRLGRGAYGSVWEIERDVAGEPERCALKVVGVPPEGDWDGSLGLGYDEGALSRSYGEQADQVLREYQLMASLSHPNVVACRDVAKVPHAGDPGCDVYIRMELLTPLPRWLRGREPDPRDAARAGLDVARALEACEARGIVHRDIKPANIMVDGYGNFKLGDFGVARTMEGTRTATVAGTESFMAPEVERRERYNQTVDIYSLGLVMWWMLSGYRGPFMPAGVIAPGDVARAEARRLQGEPVPAPDGCPEGLASIVLKACAFRPEDRYQGAAELAGDLEAFLSGGRADRPESRPGQERGPRPGRRGPAGPGAPAAAGDEGGDSMWPDAGDETVGRQCQRGVVRDAPPAEAGPTLAHPAERQTGAKARPTKADGRAPRGLGEAKKTGAGACAPSRFDVRYLILAGAAITLGMRFVGSLFALFDSIQYYQYVLDDPNIVDANSAASSLESEIVVFGIQFLSVFALCVVAYFVSRRILGREGRAGNVFSVSLSIGMGSQGCHSLLYFFINIGLDGGYFTSVGPSYIALYALVAGVSLLWLARSVGKLEATFACISPFPLEGDSGQAPVTTVAIALGLLGLGGARCMGNIAYGIADYGPSALSWPSEIIPFAIPVVAAAMPTIWFYRRRGAQSRMYAQLCMVVLVGDVVGDLLGMMMYTSSAIPYLVSLVACVATLAVCLPLVLRPGSGEKASRLGALLGAGTMGSSVARAANCGAHLLGLCLGGFSDQVHWDLLAGLLYAIIAGVLAFAFRRHIHNDRSGSVPPSACSAS